MSLKESEFYKNNKDVLINKKILIYYHPIYNDGIKYLINKCIDMFKNIEFVYTKDFNDFKFKSKDFNYFFIQNPNIGSNKRKFIYNLNENKDNRVYIINYDYYFNIDNNDFIERFFIYEKFNGILNNNTINCDFREYTLWFKNRSLNTI